jgi:hypothetical protein
MELSLYQLLVPQLERPGPRGPLRPRVLQARLVLHLRAHPLPGGEPALLATFGVDSTTCGLPGRKYVFTFLAAEARTASSRVLTWVSSSSGFC